MQSVSLKKNTLRTVVLLGVIVVLATGCFKSATEDRQQPTTGSSGAQGGDSLPVTATLTPPPFDSTVTTPTPGSFATLPPIVQTTTALAATRSGASAPQPAESVTPGPSPTPNPFQPTLAPSPTNPFPQATEPADTQTDTDTGAGTDTANPGDPCTHTIQPGENLFRIGLQYEVSTEELASYNGITDVNAIYAGQVLRIPNCGAGSTGSTGAATTGGTGSSGGAVTGGQPYTVQAGETLYALAARWGVDMQDILDANPDITDPDSVYAGQVITIP